MIITVLLAVLAPLLDVSGAANTLTVLAAATSGGFVGGCALADVFPTHRNRTPRRRR